MAKAKTVTIPETVTTPEPAKTKTLDADLVAKVKETFESAEIVAVREANGSCAAIRAVAVLHPTVPVAEFKAAAVSVSINAATAGIQRRAALNAARS